MDKIKELTRNFYKESGIDIDAVAVGVLDFKSDKHTFIEIYKDQCLEEKSMVYFDLASLTKPLMNSLVYLNEKLDDKDLDLLLNHRAGIPAWGLLPKHGWKEQILSYNIKESVTLYSDFSALRFMLEVEKKTGESYKSLVSKNLDEDLKFWTDLNGSETCIQNGFYRLKPNIGKVHDPNAYNLNCYTSHAGLFGTIESVGNTLLNFQKKHDLLKKMNIKTTQRFFNGFDTVEDPINTLAGAGCSTKTFGHLGFTGTSFWIDPDSGLGHIILTNSTKKSWFHKERLNEFRRELGQHIWNKST